MKSGLVTALLLGLMFFAGCNQPVAPTPRPSAADPTAPSGQPQAKLPTLKIWLGDKEILAEQASTPSQVQTGMMFRTQMGENEGMLFIFAAPMRASFWMRNTLLPLSCAYIDPSGTILEIHDMTPLDETPIQASTGQVQYVLEMKQGWFERNHIGVGTSVRTERGSLSQTYFGQP
jgi:hypothetical protein